MYVTVCGSRFHVASMKNRRDTLALPPAAAGMFHHALVSFARFATLVAVVMPHIVAIAALGEQLERKLQNVSRILE